MQTNLTSTENSAENDICPIKRQLLSECTKVKKLEACGHRFDHFFLLRHLEITPLCPLCRCSVSDKEIEQMAIDAVVDLAPDEDDDILYDDGKSASDEEYQPEVHEDQVIVARPLSTIPAEMEGFIVDDSESSSYDGSMDESFDDHEEASLDDMESLEEDKDESYSEDEMSVASDSTTDKESDKISETLPISNFESDVSQNGKTMSVATRQSKTQKTIKKRKIQ